MGLGNSYKYYQTLLENSGIRSEYYRKLIMKRQFCSTRVTVEKKIVAEYLYTKTNWFFLC